MNVATTRRTESAATEPCERCVERAVVRKSGFRLIVKKWLKTNPFPSPLRPCSPCWRQEGDGGGGECPGTSWGLENDVAVVLHVLSLRVLQSDKANERRPAKKQAQASLMQLRKRSLVHADSQFHDLVAFDEICLCAHRGGGGL